MLSTLVLANEFYSAFEAASSVYALTESSDYPSSFFYNPALASSAKRMALSLGVTLSGGAVGASLGYLHPTRIGNFGVIGVYSGTYTGGILGYSRAIKNVSVGLSLGGGASTTGFYFYHILGSSFSLPFEFNLSSSENFKISSPVASIVVRDLAYDWRELAFASSARFFQDRYNDLSFGLGFGLNQQNGLLFSMGLRENFRKFLRFALGLDLGYRPAFTAGLTFSMTTSSLLARLSIGWGTWTDFSKLYFSGDVAFGNVDTEPPVIDFRSSGEYVSPNYDGVNDYYEIRPGIKDTTLIAWRVRIVDSNGKTVKVWEGGQVEALPKLGSNITVVKYREKKQLRGIVKTIKELFIPSKVEAPESITWDGKDYLGKQVPDGKYKVIVEAVDYWRRTNKKETFVTVDTTPPVAEPRVTQKVFTPNGDGIDDKLVVEINGKNTGFWKAYVTDAAGNVVWEIKSPDYEKKKEVSLPAVIEWDGKTSKGKLAADGTYNFHFVAMDRAGNKAVKEIHGVVLTTAKKSIVVTASASDFSPNGDGKFDSVIFRVKLSSTEFLKGWTLYVKKGAVTVWKKEGKEASAEIVWNGEGAEQDGTYTYYAEAEFEGYGKITSPEQQIQVDTKAPEVSLKVYPLPFSPDWDGVNDELYIEVKAEDASPIEAWRVVVYSPYGKPFKVFEGKGKPQGRIIWDGVGDNGELVDSAEDYKVVVENVSDAVGNSAEPVSQIAPTDILVIPTPQGLKIRISSIHFDFDSARITDKKSLKILTRLSQILKKYPDYKICIVGHTDSDGEEDYNLYLSVARAESVRRFLKRKGIHTSRMEIAGFGESQPIDTNETPEGKARNRRVEFYLIKPSYKGPTPCKEATNYYQQIIGTESVQEILKAPKTQKFLRGVK